ncbi:hypothetical protein V6N11_051069 [Hibiscus sabdariffa]|uniref:Secreted protein n=1 Tax=Hibiscus sabdariffa TaxID=183260 RepID=A0ABR2R2W1_9ROSI
MSNVVVAFSFASLLASSHTCASPTSVAASHDSPTHCDDQSAEVDAPATCTDKNDVVVEQVPSTARSHGTVLGQAATIPVFDVCGQTALPDSVEIVHSQLEVASVGTEGIHRCAAE